MKRIIGLAAGVLATFLIVGPGFAADSVRESTSVEKPGKLAMPHRVTGNVVSVDESAGTFTVQDSKGRDYVLKADPTLGFQLSDVRAGLRGGLFRSSVVRGPPGHRATSATGRR